MDALTATVPLLVALLMALILPGAVVSFLVLRGRKGERKGFPITVGEPREKHQRGATTNPATRREQFGYVDGHCNG